MKIKHYSIFTKLSTDKIDWNQLRDSDYEAPYFIPYNKVDYLALIEGLDYKYYIESIIDYCKCNNLTRIISIGSGRCGLEYHLKNKSNLEVIVTDTTDSMNRIKNFELFDDAVQFNLMEEPLKIEVTSNTLILLSRIDTEFDDEGFMELFSTLKKIDTKYICLIPAELLSIKILIAEFKILLYSAIKREKRVFCGFARSKSEFKKAWQKYFKEVPKYSNNKIFQLIQK